MTSPKRFLIVCGLLLLVGASTSRTGAQMRKPGDPLTPSPAEQQRDAEQFVDIVNVSVVNIDAYVTDKQGKVVTGLTKDDFQIFENGRPVEVSNFYAVN